MANEVIIGELESPRSKNTGNLVPVHGRPVTSQVLDIATASAAFNSKTSYINIQSKGTGFWWKLGTSAAVSAAADTDGNFWLPADQSIDIDITGYTHIDTAA